MLKDIIEEKTKKDKDKLEEDFYIIKDEIEIQVNEGSEKDGK